MAPTRKRGPYLQYLRSGSEGKDKPRIPRSSLHKMYREGKITAQELAAMGVYPSQRRWKKRNEGTDVCEEPMANFPAESGGEDDPVSEEQPTSNGPVPSSTAQAEDGEENQSDEELSSSSQEGCSETNVTEPVEGSVSSFSITTESDSDSSVSNSDMSELMESENSDLKKEQDDIKFSKHVGFEVLNQTLTDKPALVSKFEALLMIFHLATRFGHTKDFLLYQMKFVNQLLGDPDALMESSYLFQKLFMFASQPQIHYYCPECEMYLGTNSIFPEDVVCSKCQWNKTASSHNDGYYFVTLSVRKQIENLLKRTDIEFVTREPSGECLISDIKDGFLYQRTLKNIDNGKDALTISFNTDGCPIFNCGPNSLWPIQFYINEIHPKQRFNSENILLAGLWFGKKDPVMNIFLQPFVNELDNLRTQGVVWEKENGVVVESPIYALCCCTDSAARPKLQNLMSFNGAFGCGYCLHPNTKFTVVEKDPKAKDNNGEPVLRSVKIQRYLVDEGRQYSLRTNKELRKHMTMAENSHLEHVYGAKGKSVLYALPKFDVVFGFPIDYMHSVLLGVVKRLAGLWFDSSSHGSDYYIGLKSYLVDERLAGIAVLSHMRNTTPISDRCHWKARQWKDFLLYYGLPCLSNLLPDKYYKHFLKLSQAIFTLLQESMTYNEVEEANDLLDEFVTEYQELYGEFNMVYNTHLLTHLGYTVSRLGPLWAYSLFSFESGNGRLKSLVKGTRGVATQISKKYLMAQTVEKLLRNSYISTDNILEFCGEIIGYKYAKHSFKIKNVVFFENGSFVDLDEEQREAMQMYGKAAPGKVVVYRKALLNDVICKSKKLSCQTRKNDSCVRLSDGTYGLIEYIIRLGVSTADSDVFCFVRNINIAMDVCSMFPAHIKHCSLDPYGDLKLISADSIVKKCIFMSCAGKYFVGETCNSYEKE